MAFRKKTAARILDQIKKRLSAMEQIDATQGKTINYGSERKPLTTAEVKAIISKYDELISRYNQMLQEADTLGDQITEVEAEMKDMHSQILVGGKAEFGSDSYEVQQLGGTRKSERKKPKRKNNK